MVSAKLAARQRLVARTLKSDGLHFNTETEIEGFFFSLLHLDKNIARRTIQLFLT